MANASEDPIEILCVDDEPGLADLIAEMVAKHSDRIETRATTEPQEALDLLEQTRVDCVVSDYDMPKMDGLELLEAVRESFPNKPFFLFTGRGSEEIASEAISKGVTDYLQKEGGTQQYELLANRCVNAVENARHREQLERAEKWYLQLFDQSLIGVGLSQDGVYKQANDLFALILGYDTAEVIGMDVVDTIAPTDRQRVRRALEQRESGETDQVRYTVSLERKDGSTRMVDVLGGRVMYEGQPAILGLIRPVGNERSVPGPLIERMSVALDALGAMEGDLPAEARKAEKNLQRAQELVSDPVADGLGEQTDTPLSEAAHEAWNLLEPGPESELRVLEEAQIAVQKKPLVHIIEQILVGSIGSDPTGATVTLGPTNGGFEIRIQAPGLEQRADNPLTSDVQSPPAPIIASQWGQAIDVYSTIECSDTVAHEVVFASMLS